MRRLVVLAAVVTVGCAGACDFRCHMQHVEVTYHAAYTTQDCTCWSRDDETLACTFETCSPVDHPAECNVATVCDMRCKAVDTGAAEAHADHRPRETHAPIVDVRCTPQGKVKP